MIVPVNKMGSEVSSFLFMPLLLGTACAVMIWGLISAKKHTECSDKHCEDKCKDVHWGSKVFQQDMWIGAFIIISAVLVQFLEGLQI